MNKAVFTITQPARAEFTISELPVVEQVDTTPNAFTFTDQTGVATSSERTSNTITVAGLGDGVSVVVSITGGTYSKNGGAYTSSAGTAVNGDTFAVRHTSSASNSTATNTTLTIGGVSDTFTSTTEAAAVSYNAVGFGIGQSRIVATHNVDNSTLYGDGFTDETVAYLNAAWLNNPGSNPQTLPARVIKTGATINGIAGPAREYDSPNGAGPLSGLAYQKNHGDADFLPNAQNLYLLKNAGSGQPATSMAPGGGLFGTRDAMEYRIVDLLAQSGTPLRAAFDLYGQGSAEASTVHNALLGTYGSDPANLIPPSLADTRIANWGDLIHQKSRPSYRDAHGIPNLPFFMLGYVLPDRDDPTRPNNSYTAANQANMARIREGVEAEARSICRYYVTFTGTTLANLVVNITDRGANAPRLTPTYNSGTDKVTFAEGSADPRCDDFSVYISLRGWQSNDGLHEESDVDFMFAKAMKEVLQTVFYSASGGEPGTANTIARVRPRFYDEPYVSGSVGSNSVTVAYQASFLQGGVCDSFIGVYAAGSTPTGTEIASGAGAGFLSAHNNAGIGRRTTESQSITGLSTGTAYRIAQVLRDGNGTYSRVKYLDITTTGAGDTTPPTITSANAVSVAENAPLAHTLTADETVTWAIVGGADAAQFNISGVTLRWIGDGDQDFELPQDADSNNIYEVAVRATDLAGNQSTSQTINVTVTDVAEGGGGSGITIVDTQNAAGGAAITINYTAQENDLALLWVKTGDEPVTPPSGWSIIATASTGNNGNLSSSAVARVTLLSRTVGAGDGGSVTVADTGAYQIGVVSIIRGAGAVTTQTANTDATTAQLVTSFDAPNLASAAANSLVFAATGDSIDATVSNMAGVSNATLGSLTTRADLQTNASHGGGLHIVSGTLAAGGSTGATAFTFTTQTGVAAITLAIAPAS